MDLTGQRILVLGLGTSGFSACRWLHAHGAIVVAADTRSQPPLLEALRLHCPAVGVKMGPPQAQWFEGIDSIVISPGLSIEEAGLSGIVASGIPVIGDIELFARALQLQDPAGLTKIIGITGSNGKSTVTSLIGHLIRHAGFEVVMAGNIGLAALDALGACEQNGQQPQVYVLELSSFQLDNTYSLYCDSGTILNISADHLDRYKRLDRYIASKARLLERVGLAVLNREDPYLATLEVPGTARVRRFGLGEPECDGDLGLTLYQGERWISTTERCWLPLRQLPLIGNHNVANVLAALALIEPLDIPMAQAVEGLLSFQSLPHRLERVAVANGVEFVNDSKGTNVGATVAALQAFRRADGLKKVWLIAGGDGKGQDFKPLGPQAAVVSKGALLIGRDADRVEAALAAAGVCCQRFERLAEAVEAARRHAVPGDIVLLSPACASLDMFRDYSDRGQQFTAAAQAAACSSVKRESNGA